MPETKVIFYKENKCAPMVNWLEEVYRQDKKALEKCFAQIELLKAFGHELRRPHADFLRDGIYELRISFRRVQYRILYFFFGQNIVVLSHGITKEGKVPDTEINRAIERKIRYEMKPETHSWEEGE
ncbi:MAG: type II toxin-antitoxin system RelE/ParE family toxin [Candidatus Hinthialibacter antarcticus]|nr:type II toxin-antitoxin system RelE/ParE family toxin [Candidatus Hinthialibacter antarcticus]